ncbi:hypothetical protein BKA93DRAFT_816135 [Sparassis latifolia]|uniref:PQ loop repeat protein n=1 Tax=Sparassis crispa TaxID=139825 RepID=A0A401GN75_9APHY|nr:Uncharacterized protein SCP_0507180 [Sparassis crispa]GBE83663.1 Uncharacterized protein SCP_0507180 [Sparassis crispa]
MSETCVPHHDYAANLLTGFLCIGITISYLPQHLRIILTKSSEGFSPWFLLLGSTSSASAMLNIIVMQWGIVKCCRVLSFGNCVESVAGIFQVFLTWFLFVLILVLYMIYYPRHLKYAELDVDMHDNRPPHHIKTPVPNDEWRLSIILSWVVFLHILFITFVTFLLLSTKPSPDPSRRSTQISLWATFLGVTSAALATLQYLPQLTKTYRLKLVGALSIKSMLMQSPGAVLMVLSVALRPDTNWTTWLVYAVAGILQGALLIMCICWRVRQRRLGIDDFGNPLASLDTDSPADVTRGPDGGMPLEVAVDVAVEADLRDDLVEAVAVEGASEMTPLLARKSQSEGEEEQSGSRWFEWLRRTR